MNSDVATINAAIATFLANGGDLEGANTAEEVIARVKTRDEAGRADQLVGLRGSFLDPRITPVAQDSSESASTAPRAYWSPAKERFVVAYNGAIGIKQFVLDDSKADAVEVEYKRRHVVEYAKKGEDKWVWEYGDHNTAAATGPKNLALATVDPTVPPPLGSPTALPLDPPVPSLPGDNYALIDYEDVAVTLTNPNPSGTSDIFYSIEPGVWERYLGPIPVEPGTNLEVQTVSTDPDVWSDSPVAVDEYRTTPVKLKVAAAFSKPSYDYVSLGGALLPGSYVPPVLAEPGAVTLTNAASIPVSFQNSSTFEMRWTFDGSDPLTSPTAMTGDPFSGGFPGEEIPFGIDDWGSDSALPIYVAARSLNTDIVSDSEVMVYSLGRDRIQLRPPLIEIDPASGEGILCHDADFGDMPLGAWIYYTTDNTDPGIAPDGGTLTGTLYSEPIPGADSDPLMARVYAPVLYRDWFIPSDVATENPAGSPPPLFFTDYTDAVFGLIKGNGTNPKYRHKTNNGHGNNYDGIDGSNPATLMNLPESPEATDDELREKMPKNSNYIDFGESLATSNLPNGMLITGRRFNTDQGQSFAVAYLAYHNGDTIENTEINETLATITLNFLTPEVRTVTFEILIKVKPGKGGNKGSDIVSFEKPNSVNWPTAKFGADQYDLVPDFVKNGNPIRAVGVKVGQTAVFDINVILVPK